MVFVELLVFLNVNFLPRQEMADGRVIVKLPAESEQRRKSSSVVTVAVVVSVRNLYLLDFSFIECFP